MGNRKSDNRKRRKLFSVTKKDLKVETFRAGGSGGQNQNKRNTGVRIRHEPSGAVGEARDGREQGINKKNAFIRMTQDPKFMVWVRMQAGLSFADDLLHIEEDLRYEDLKIEVRRGGKWVEE